EYYCWLYYSGVYIF
nr:immunoglobulin light chain junction region [Macaca mulatta]